ncbi:protein-L-isoaspartate O-methyltransferase [Sphingomonas oleivorans]|uniref:Protein-L-isoaspartate O-methyltransferase n=1 Tax=Sphingomonas oleivorans TaxID=1735121 RepID=A0A2T5FZQ5_9SPHN|nr:methyltransferase domain-containing protein [Sphingomonas oleivorans]PTQ12179.1 protein-L-isoaspartate O-methyltransferase [Sphingomonas oleivorans]
MFSSDELTVIRRAYAKQILFQGRSVNPELEAAFAKVERERFLGPGPWPIFNWPRGYQPTPDGDPAWLCADVLVGIEPDRGLNNGQPSSHAAWISAVRPMPGEHLVHVGAGVGYYSAVMSEMVGPSGKVTAIEYDPGLARRAALNLSGLPNVHVIEGDGSVTPFDAADVVYVNAGVSHPADLWLDNLRDGGRLLLPLTTNSNFSKPKLTQLSGAVFLVQREGEEFQATFISQIAVYPCEGMRDEVSEKALVDAFQRPGIQNVRKLRRTEEVEDGNCWMKAPGWSLTFS